MAETGETGEAQNGPEILGIPVDAATAAAWEEFVNASEAIDHGAPVSGSANQTEFEFVISNDDDLELVRSIRLALKHTGRDQGDNLLLRMIVRYMSERAEAEREKEAELVREEAAEREAAEHKTEEAN